MDRNQIVPQANRSIDHFRVQNVKWHLKLSSNYSGIAYPPIANQKGAKIKQNVLFAQHVDVAFANWQHCTTTKPKRGRKKKMKIGVLPKNIKEIENRK